MIFQYRHAGLQSMNSHSYHTMNLLMENCHEYVTSCAPFSSSIKSNKTVLKVNEGIKIWILDRRPKIFGNLKDFYLSFKIYDLEKLIRFDFPFAWSEKLQFSQDYRIPFFNQQLEPWRIKHCKIREMYIAEYMKFWWE